MCTIHWNTWLYTSNLQYKRVVTGYSTTYYIYVYNSLHTSNVIGTHSNLPATATATATTTTTTTATTTDSSTSSSTSAVSAHDDSAKSAGTNHTSTAYRSSPQHHQQEQDHLDVEQEDEEESATTEGENDQAKQPTAKKTDRLARNRFLAQSRRDEKRRKLDISKEKIKKIHRRNDELKRLNRGLFQELVDHGVNLLQTEVSQPGDGAAMFTGAMPGLVVPPAGVVAGREGAQPQQMQEAIHNSTTCPTIASGIAINPSTSTYNSYPSGLYNHNFSPLFSSEQPPSRVNPPMTPMTTSSGEAASNAIMMTVPLASVSQQHQQPSLSSSLPWRNCPNAENVIAAPEHAGSTTLPSLPPGSQQQHSSLGLVGNTGIATAADTSSGVSTDSSTLIAATARSLPHQNDVNGGHPPVGIQQQQGPIIVSLVY
jgi:hypothetical protein